MLVLTYKEKERRKWDGEWKEAGLLGKYLFSRFDFGTKQILVLKRNNRSKMESLVVSPTKA